MTKALADFLKSSKEEGSRKGKEMKLNERFLEKVNKNYSEKHRNGVYKNSGLGINVSDSIKGATVFKNNWAICELDELQQMIDELEMMKQAIEEETGICF